MITFLLPRGHVVPVTEMAEKRGLAVCQKMKTVLFLVEVKSLVSTRNFFYVSGCGGLLRKLSKDSLYSFSRIAWFLSKSALMLQVLLQLVATGLLVNIQNCCMIHTANITLDYLHEVFGPCVILDWYPGHHAWGRIWPHSSLHINPCSFFFWRFIK